MFIAHSFRLRPPWECEAAGAGEVRWSRVFHRPTGLEPTDELWLVISGLPEGARVSLNEQSLADPPAAKPGQYRITHLLEDANRIAIEYAGEPSGDFPLDVRLGIVGHE